ncbi:glycosyltransferase family 4 protein [Bradyrhizobium sp. INPA01-394B]|uniref:Glycosyltransferase family 4 protein n=1 Tax=Bradyrhizobium campsiandrae TaxID=1729892 RepID=A0ABR7U9D5_9BRAD|nr:glycosyltransferase family 1 protein [Bradyrhizobium campsiandrae]MBC9877542.1 glycosyltransferase family 4 protein [Bradyrhizobium campsiandrae]MBC9980463.1 glycosyltransferase family 4 protein [Bradyrhizobium campsiandrae]
MSARLGVVALSGPNNGGTYQYTLAMLHGLRHVAGFDITLYGDSSNPDFAELGYPIVPFAETRRQQVTALAARRLHLALPDPFAAEDLLLAPIYSLALLHTSKPFAFTLHDLQENYYPQNFSRWQRIWRHETYAALLGRARRVICESRHVKADIANSFGVAGERIKVIPAPPQRQFLTRQPDAELEAVRQRLQLPQRFLFYPAQFWVHKNHLRLVEAFGEVLKQAPDLKLVLTGKQRDEYRNVMDAVNRLGLGANVVHVGFVERDELQAIYRLATALVMPSLFESISIPVYEAFLAGTPVIASDIHAIPEQVGDAGLLFDPTSVASIAHAILKVVQNGDLAKDLVAKARERMQQMTPEHYGEQLQDLLDEMRD